MYDALNATMDTFTRIIGGATVASIRGNAPTPSSAREQFLKFMKYYQSTGSFPSNPAEGWKGFPSGLPEHDRTMDDLTVHSMEITDSGIRLLNVVTAYWEMKIVMGKDVDKSKSRSQIRDDAYYYRNIPHHVNHVSVRLREEGYNLYHHLGGKGADGEAIVVGHIEGRDIIYMAAMLAAPAILKKMKEVLLYEVFAR